MTKAVIAIHGGAGTLTPSAQTSALERQYIHALSEIITRGQDLLAEGACAVDAVVEAVRLLEECPLFNAGIGSVFTAAATHELDACVMDGRSLQAGAVAGVSHIRNPILVAKAVMDATPHALLIGKGAEDFAIEQGFLPVAGDFFSTDFRYQQLCQARGQGAIALDHTPQAPLDPATKFGTVGAVALDAQGNLAAATSTGGMTNKLPGRVGDSPLIGAGCYANNANVAVSCTGTGEVFMRTLAAYDIAALMEYGQLSLYQATERVVMEKLPALGGQGGMIAIDNQGNVVMPFNTPGMYRGFGYVGDAPCVGIYSDKEA